jgi:hypothetical protein
VPETLTYSPSAKSSTLRVSPKETSSKSASNSTTFLNGDELAFLK